MRLDAGVYRLHPNSLVYEGFFNWDTNSLGPYTTEPEYGYIEEYHVTKGEPPKSYLYKALRDFPEVLAAIFINNSYICCLRAGGSVFYLDAFSKETRYSNRSWVYNQKIDVIPIGYELTKYKCQSVFMRPAQLMYSLSRRAVYLEERWVPLYEDVELMQKDNLILYKELVSKQDKNCVYLRKGGEAVWSTFTV